MYVFSGNQKGRLIDAILHYVFGFSESVHHCLIERDSSHDSIQMCKWKMCIDTVACKCTCQFKRLLYNQILMKFKRQ